MPAQLVRVFAEIFSNAGTNEMTSVSDLDPTGVRIDSVTSFGSRHAMAFVAVMAAACFAARAADVSSLAFETHAAFFSKETGQPRVLDPQVFVLDQASTAATGPQGIKHVAGVRNALVADNPTLPIFNAARKSLDMSLGAWLSAKGDVGFAPQRNGRQKITVILSGLKPRGHYSLFENHFDQKPVGFTPLDGDGVDNSFVADAGGKAVFSAYSPNTLTHDNAVLLVYHSDGMSHGKSRGEIGLDAHHQLILRP